LKEAVELTVSIVTESILLWPPRHDLRIVPDVPNILCRDRDRVDIGQSIPSIVDFIAWLLTKEGRRIARKQRAVSLFLS
jgi:hypothetical protein